MIRHSMFSCKVLTEEGLAPALVDRDDIVFCSYENGGVNIALRSGTELRLLEIDLEELWADYEPNITDGFRG